MATEPLSSEEASKQRSIEMLQCAAQAADVHAPDAEHVGFYASNGVDTYGLYEVEEFLEAVTFYTRNRDSDLSINFALYRGTNPTVNVYEEANVITQYTPIIAKVPMYMVWQMLEVGFRILQVQKRQDQKQ